ncbi:MAG TPA: condensation domain-containing protein, partial [Polyangiaceae bacterium]|nr:condensation domain-containing protein [Polyangiaceae bacterium]
MADISSSSFDPFAGPTILATAPSTEPQREIWTACALGDEATLAFNESILLKLRGALDVPAFHGALSDLVARHEALRITFSGDGLTLLVGAPFEAQLTQRDLSELSAEAADSELTRLATAEVSLPFDLGKGPLFRAHLLGLPRSRDAAEQGHALIFTAHHIVCDGWSTAVLLRDWAAFYNARKRAAVASLPEADSFSGYARARAELTPPTRQRDEAYWVKQFEGELPILDLPSERARPSRKTFNAGREDLVLAPELVVAVRRAGSKARASLFATLLAAFNVLVHRLTGQADLIVGIPAAGQAAEGRNELVGHCVNML